MNRRRLNALATLLRIRRRQEDLKAQALAQARRDVRVATDQRDEIEAYQRRMLERAGEMTQGDFDASAVRQVYQHERHLSRLAAERDVAIRRLDQVAETRRGELEMALKRRRMVEQLETRAATRYRDFRNQQEQKQNDEIATSRAVRNAENGTLP